MKHDKNPVKIFEVPILKHQVLINDKIIIPVFIPNQILGMDVTMTQKRHRCELLGTYFGSRFIDTVSIRYFQIITPLSIQKKKGKNTANFLKMQKAVERSKYSSIRNK